MKIIIVRHGEPDYEHDSLTEKGWREAELLSRRLTEIPACAYYCSPLGRAKDTAKITMQKLEKEATILDWLEEFDARIFKPNKPERLSCTWDWLPADWTADERFFDFNKWYDNEIMANSGVKQKYERVIGEFDKLIKKHGYIRESRYYRAEKSNNDTIILFCHFGVECVLLSGLLNISPMALWHGTCAAPTSVTTVVTEERRKGIAYFRMLSFGDTSHLYAGNEKPSFAARFVEKYGNEGERVD